MKEPVTFEQAWASYEAKGYQYGRDALEQVRFGWEIAHEFAPPPSPQPRDGWVLVPREPTPEMVQAAFEQVELNGFPGFATGNDARRAIYAAMIAAAPQSGDAS